MSVNSMQKQKQKRNEIKLQQQKPKLLDSNAVCLNCLKHTKLLNKKNSHTHAYTYTHTLVILIKIYNILEQKHCRKEQRQLQRQ